MREEGFQYRHPMSGVPAKTIKANIIAFGIQDVHAIQQYCHQYRLYYNSTSQVKGYNWRDFKGGGIFLNAV